MARKAPGFFISWIIGIVVAVILLFVLNILASSLNYLIFKDIVQFINNNLLLLILISLLFFFGSLFYSFGFPINLGSHIFDAAGLALLVFFIIKLIVFLDKYINTGIGDTLQPYANIISAVVFILTALLGYLFMLKNGKRRGRHYEEYSEDREEDVDEEDYDDERDYRPVRRRHSRRIFRRKRP